ncbi:MAG TPA: hypothetical protein VMT15_19590 [Bryobacteraceae bacterium]|nr:hypothetical protein [Bryobacteraceae bacterium]
MKKDWLFQTARRITSSALVTAALFACPTAVDAADNTQDDKWQFTITPYLWVPKISGSLNVTPPPAFQNGNLNLNIGPINYLEHLKFAGMGDIQVRKGKWSVLADTIYLDLSNPNGQATIPAVLPGGAGLTVNANTSLNTLLFESALGYSIVRNERSNFDLVAGTRYARIESNVALDVSGLPPAWVSSGSAYKQDSYLDPIFGFKGKFALGKKWSLPYYFDVGGFGASSDLTLQASTAIDYRFKDWFSLEVGYRYMHYKFADQKPVKNLDLYGGILGLSFSF